MKFSQFLESKQQYIIFQDMDGCLTDFEGEVAKHTNKSLEQLDKDNELWTIVNNQGISFWKNMSWMKDGKELWKYITSLSIPIKILSSPGKSKVAPLGKKIWCKRELGNYPVILAQAEEKAQYAKPNHILIDDRKSNISEWKKSGGIGILYTSTKSTIKQLKEILHACI